MDSGKLCHSIGSGTLLVNYFNKNAKRNIVKNTP